MDGRARYGPAGQVPRHGDADHHHEQQRRTADAGTDDPADDRAEEDRREGAHLHDGVAADQLARIEVLRQDRVFERAEECRLRAQQEQHGEQGRHALEVERKTRQDRHGDLAELDDADQPRLLDLVGERTGGRGEQEERQDQEAGDQIHVDARVGTLGDQAAEHEHQREGLLEHVVVEGTEELRHEERS